MKKIISCLLVLAVTVSALCVNVFAADDRGTKTVELGKTMLLNAKGSSLETNWWSDDDDIVSVEFGSRAGLDDLKQCRIRGESAGTTRVHVTYQSLNVNFLDLDAWYSPTMDNNTVEEVWTVTVEAPGANADNEDAAPGGAAVPDTQKDGRAGEDVSKTITNVSSASFGLIPVERNNLWGFADINLKLVIPFQYDEVGEFRLNGLAPVIVGEAANNIYVINTKGDYVLDKPYHSVDLCGDKVIKAVERKGGKDYNFYFTLKGEESTGEAFVKAARAYKNAENERFFQLYTEDGNGGVDEDGNYIFVCRHAPENASFKYKNKDGQMFFYTDVSEYAKSFTVPLPDSVARIHAFIDGAAVIENDEGLYGVINKSGKIIIPMTYDFIADSYGHYLPYKKDGKFGVMENPANPPDDDEGGEDDEKSDKKVSGSSASNSKSSPEVGDIVTDQITSILTGYTCGLCPVKIGGKWGFVDENDKLVIPCIFEDTWYFNEEYKMTTVKFKDGQNAIDVKGNVLLSRNYDEVSLTSPYTIKAADVVDGKRTNYYFDNKGNKITYKKYKELKNSSGNSSPKAGDIVTDLIDLKVEDLYACGLCPVKIDGKWGYVDDDDRLVIPCKFELTFGFREDINMANVTFEDGDNVIDLKGNVILSRNYYFASATSPYTIVANDKVDGKTIDYYFDNKGNEITYEKCKELEDSYWGY